MTAALNPMPAADLAKASLDRLDAVASAMERKWGIDRLPKLVDAPLAVRFRSQAERLDEAIRSDVSAAVSAQAEAMLRAWNALDAAAITAGWKPLAPTIWETVLPETELPNEVAIGFTDAIDDYKSGAVSANRLAGYSERKSDIRLALVLDQVQAQSIADRALVEAWIERETAGFALPPARIALDPGDVVDLVINGTARAFRLKRVTDRGARDVEAVRAEAAIYTPPLNGIAPPTLAPPPIYGAAVLRLLDLPLLRDSDDGFSPYAAASAAPWGGVVVMDSATGSDFTLDTTLAVRATLGETIQPFPAGPSEYWDEASVLEVKLYAGELASATPEAILTDSTNSLAIGTPDGDWEIVQFADAVLTAPQTYRLTKLLRGRLGTEHAMRSPLALGAPVILLNEAVLKIDGKPAERLAARFYRWGPPALDIADPAWQQTTYATKAAGRMPWSPVQIAGARNGGGDLAITWVRRTRFGGVWADARCRRQARCRHGKPDGVPFHRGCPERIR